MTSVISLQQCLQWLKNTNTELVTAMLSYVQSFSTHQPSPLSMYVHCFLTTDDVKHASLDEQPLHKNIILALTSFPGHTQPWYEAMLALVQQKSN